MKEKIIGITLGIRFSRSFRVPDISGDIVDHLLYDERTPFGPDFFPQIQERTNREKTLFYTDELGNAKRYLRINTDDLILGFDVEGNFDEKYNWLRNDVVSYFQDKLFRKFNIKNIQRIGIIFSHQLTTNTALNDAVSTLTQENVSAVDNISVSFSKKRPANEALYRSGVQDYKNTIYNLKETGNSIYADLDYQYYFDPPVIDLRECFVEKILNDAQNFLEKSFHHWLQNYEINQK